MVVFYLLCDSQPFKWEHAQHQSTGPPEWNRAIINVIIYTCVYPAIWHKHGCCEKDCYNALFSLTEIHNHKVSFKRIFLFYTVKLAMVESTFTQVLYFSTILRCLYLSISIFFYFIILFHYISGGNFFLHYIYFIN